MEVVVGWDAQAAVDRGLVQRPSMHAVGVRHRGRFGRVGWGGGGRAEMYARLENRDSPMLGSIMRDVHEEAKAKT